MNISQYACVWLALCISFPRVVAGASRPAALTGSARAAYQICLHWNVPVDYDDLSTLMQEVLQALVMHWQQHR